MSTAEQAGESGAIADAAFEMASEDVLTAWRVRNAALAVAATFVHPGPDHEDHRARQALVEEWVSDGHDQVAEENRQRTVMLGRMARAEAENGRLWALLREVRFNEMCQENQPDWMARIDELEAQHSASPDPAPEPV